MSIFSRALLIGGLAALQTATAFGQGPAAPSTITEEQVTTAVKRGVDFLLENKHGDNWEVKKNWKYEPQVGGETMMAAYALLTTAQSFEDPRLAISSPEMAPVVKYITEFDAKTTYVAALQANALSLLPAKPEYRKALERVKGYLVKSQTANGGYTYVQEQGRRWDNSNAQYGVLGVWSASETGLEAPNAYWTSTEKFWREQQNADGGWGYNFSHKDSRRSMCPAGLASLFITTQYTDTTVRLEPKPDRSIENGLAYLRKNLTLEDDSANAASEDRDYFYTMYGVARVGIASGYKYFDQVEWYREGAARIVRGQNQAGYWYSNGKIVGTAYALLFLSRGGNPVLFNKLEYQGPWNARPRDAANATRWLAKAAEKPLNWQIVNLKVDGADWLDAPVLLITGSKDPRFTDSDIGKIRAFVDGGGMVFSTADGGSGEFTAAMLKTAAAVVNRKYEPRELPANHPLFSVHGKVAPALRIQAISNGVREVWVHSPTDIGSTCQRYAVASSNQWEFLLNLYMYCSGKLPPRKKLQTLAVTPVAQAAARTVGVAHISYGGNWDPEPGAWPRLAKLATAYHTKLDAKPVELMALDGAATPVAHMTGTVKTNFSEDQQAKLRSYCDAGGTLIIDVAGGGEAFAASALTLLSGLYKDTALEALPTEHPLYAGTGADMEKIDHVTYRRFMADSAGNVPRIRVLKHNGRIVAFFSAEDITSGLLGTNTWGIAGYGPASAQALMQNMLLYAGTKEP